MSAALPIIGSGEPVSAAIDALGAADALLVHIDGKPAGVITRQDLLGHPAGVIALTSDSTRWMPPTKSPPCWVNASSTTCWPRTITTPTLLTSQRPSSFSLASLSLSTDSQPFLRATVVRGSATALTPQRW